MLTVVRLSKSMGRSLTLQAHSCLAGQWIPNLVWDLEVRYHVFQESATVLIESNPVCGEGIESATSRKTKQGWYPLYHDIRHLTLCTYNLCSWKSVAKLTYSKCIDVEKYCVVYSVDTGTVRDLRAARVRYLRYPSYRVGVLPCWQSNVLSWYCEVGIYKLSG
jgi:hypothetical protein